MGTLSMKQHPCFFRPSNCEALYWHGCHHGFDVHNGFDRAIHSLTLTWSLSNQSGSLLRTRASSMPSIVRCSEGPELFREGFAKALHTLPLFIVVWRYFEDLIVCTKPPKSFRVARNQQTKTEVSTAQHLSGFVKDLLHLYIEAQLLENCGNCGQYVPTLALQGRCRRCRCGTEGGGVCGCFAREDAGLFE